VLVEQKEGMEEGRPAVEVLPRVGGACARPERRWLGTSGEEKDVGGNEGERMMRVGVWGGGGPATVFSGDGLSPAEL
jgi:hypothetical protein